jgi:hypothetical protein
MRRFAFFTTTATICVLSLMSASSAQKTTGPKAQYAMDVSTMSGFGAGMGGGMMGGLGALMGGGGGGPHYMLDLRLKSATPAPKQPETGDHFFLPAAKMGKSVSLIGDSPGQTQPSDPRDPTERDPKYEKPKGRLLMFWGCNAKAPKGQPFIIDFAKMPTAKMPAGMPDQLRGYRAAAQARDANAAWWPNGKNGKQPKSGSSLRGDHRIVSTFTPEIKYSLVNDYMGGLNVTASDQASINLSWNGLPTATGYIAWAMGGMQNAGSGGDMVMWTSANARDHGAGMDWLPPAEVQRQINQKLIMPPSQTTCSIPAEAKTAAGGTMFGSMNAFGPEENFSYPPKPADPKAVWNIEWTTKARFRSFTTFFTGEGMGGMMGGGTAGGPAPAPRKPKPCKGPFGVPIPGTSC